MRKKTVLTEDQRYKRLASRDKLDCKALAYGRVSTGEQDHSVAAQNDEFKHWQTVNSIVVDKVYFDENVEGDLDPAERPGLRALLRHVEVNEIDYVVVTHLDRLSRNVAIQGFVEFVLRRYNCRLLTIKQNPKEPLTPEQQLTRTIVAGMAEYEKSLISLRTKGALAAARKRGVQLGRRKRLSYKENCKLFYVIRYLDKYGCTLEYIKGYLANHCKTVLTDSTVSRYKNEDDIPFYFPIREVVDVLKPFYGMRNGKHAGKGPEEQRIVWKNLS